MQVIRERNEESSMEVEEEGAGAGGDRSESFSEESEESGDEFHVSSENSDCSSVNSNDFETQDQRLLFRIVKKIKDGKDVERIVRECRS